MVKNSQQIFSEIDCLLNAGRLEDARVLVSSPDRDWSDRESQLALLLINVTLYGLLPYKDEISQLCIMSDTSDFEKEIIGKILLQSEKEQGRPNQTPSHLLNPPAESAGPVNSLEACLADNAGLRQERDAEIDASKDPLADLGESKEQVVRLPEETVKHDTELPRTKATEIDVREDHFAGKLCLLENQVHEKQRLLDGRDIDLKTIQSEFDRLAAQLADLSKAKDRECMFLREQLEQREELLLLKDATIKEMEQESLDRARVLEGRLSKQRSLLATRDEEIAGLMGKISELTAEREMSERLLQEYEEESQARLRALEIRVSNQGDLLATRDSEIDRLTTGISGLNQQLAELGAETETSKRLRQRYLKQKVELSKTDELVRKSADGNDAISNQPNGLYKVWEQAVKTLPRTALPRGAAAVLIIAIGYFLASDRRTPLNYSNEFFSPTEVNISPAIAEPVQSLNVEGNRVKGQVEHTISRRAVAQGRTIDYVTRRIVSLRDEPRFGASVKAHVGARIPISVLETRGDWFKIRTAASGAIGYVRKEHLVSQNSTQ